MKNCHNVTTNTTFYDFKWVSREAKQILSLKELIIQ